MTLAVVRVVKSNLHPKLHQNEPFGTLKNQVCAQHSHFPEDLRAPFKINTKIKSTFKCIVV